MGEPAEDAVQEAFIALAAQSVMPDDPMAWMVIVMRNQFRQWHRGKGRRRDRESIVAPPNWFGPTSDVETKLDGEVITEALQQCDSPDREIVVMHLWGEMSFDSIAKVVGTSRATAHRIFQHQMNELKQRFNPAAQDELPVQTQCVCDANKNEIKHELE